MYDNHNSINERERENVMSYHQSIHQIFIKFVKDFDTDTQVCLYVIMNVM